MYENHFPDFSVSDIRYIHNGKEQCVPGKSNGPHVSNHYLFHLILSGKGSLVLNQLKYSLGKGQGFLISPRQLYQYTASTSSPWEYVWFGFGGESAKKILSNSRLTHDDPIYESANWDKLASLILESLETVQSNTTGSLLHCHGLLCLMIAQLVKETELFKPPRNLTYISSTQMNYFHMAITYMQANLAEAFTTSDVAKALSLNRSYFTRIFVQITGIKPTTFINNYRLDNAWHLIRHSETPIGKIAQLVGFSDASYFTSRFKKRYGVTPSVIRAKENKQE